MQVEHINLEDDLNRSYNVTSIKEVRTKLGSSVSAMDMWFPHVSKQLVCSWGQKDFKTYTDTLISSTRNDRAGFPFAVMAELDTIIDTHDECYPQYITTNRTYI